MHMHMHVSRSPATYLAAEQSQMKKNEGAVIISK